MCKVISIFNQKGGVAKSTTSINLSAALVEKGKKVCIVDMDSQANSTCGLGIDDEALEYTIYSLLTSRKVTKEIIHKVMLRTKYGIDILPADITLANADMTLSNAMSREHLLKNVLIHILDDYDYIFIDCPPSLGLISINSLVASNYLIIPVAMDFFSIKGTKHLKDTLELVQEKLNNDLKILGVLITKYDIRTKLSREIRTRLSNVFNNDIFETVIRKNDQIVYAQENQMPIIQYDRTCNAYIDYMKLANEVIKHGNK